MVKLPALVLVIMSATVDTAHASGSAEITFGPYGPGLQADATAYIRSTVPTPAPAAPVASDAPSAAPSDSRGGSSGASSEEVIVEVGSGFGCPSDIGSFRFSDIYGRCQIALPPIAEPEPENDRRRRPRGPSLEEIRRQAIDSALAQAPAPELRIAPGRVGLTGLPSFFWLAEEPQPISATASVRGVTVTATAAPTHYLWSFGDGEERTTSDPGRPWTPRRDGSIGHTYEVAARYELSVTVVWTASWSLNGGPPQPLGSFTTTDEAEYPVREVIAFLTRD